MGNFHTPYSSSAPKTAFTVASMGAPLIELDDAISGAKTPMLTCSGNITFDSTSGVLAWDAPIRIFAAATDGKMFVNAISSGSVTLETGDVVYADISATAATASISTVAYSTGSTGLLPKKRVLLGMVDTTTLEFYGRSLQPALRVMTAPSTMPSTVIPLGALAGREATITCAATFAVDFGAAESPVVVLTTNSSCVISNGSNGQVYRLRVQQDSTGNWTLAIGATAGSIRWRGGSAPTISTGATVSDVLTFFRSNGTWFADSATGF